jgi:4-hydroxybenzoyl-CoA reductase subunit beta
MLRLPRFDYRAPRTSAEAADMLASAPAGTAMVVAGGTDLLPNMKRRHQTPAVLIGLRAVRDLKRIANAPGDGPPQLTIGAATTLAELVDTPAIRLAHPGLWQAAAHVATPLLRNMGTIGGNLCLDTRCNYYDQNYEWRQAIGFCMKKDGTTCWVAPSSRKCLAVSSTDTAPALIALGARVTLVSTAGARELPVAGLYRDDGIHYLTRRPDELLTAVHIPIAQGARSTSWKLRRRGSFDFPVLSVAAWLTADPDGTITAARIVLGAIASRPLESAAAAASLIGKSLSDAAIADAAEIAAAPARPMDNTDFTLHWRKRMTRDFVAYALRELRGDDMTEARSRFR